jgi:gliding motility-associated-like protein
VTNQVVITVSTCTSCGATLTTPPITANQSICKENPINPIKYTTTVANDISLNGVTAGNGLPAGVKATWLGNEIVISGTPTIKGEFNYEITLKGASCTTEKVQGKLIIYDSVNPTFTAVGAYCSGAVIPALPTNSSDLQAITGTWSPTINNTKTETYIFTPAVGGVLTCARKEKMTITIHDSTSPTFTVLGPYCKDVTPDLLPLISINNITGTWNPTTIATNDVGNQSYIFTPTSSATTTCARKEMLKITIKDVPIATAGGILTTICQGSTSAAIGGSIAGGATSSTWSGGAGTWTNANDPATATYTAGASESGSITLTLTAISASCGNSVVTKTIMVSPNLTPTVSITSSDADYLICPGTSVTFTPTPIHGGTNPIYQWKLNNVNVVGSSDGTYTNTLLKDGDMVSVEMTSNQTCVLPATANSNIITIRTGTNIAPSFTLSPICAGDKLFYLPTNSSDLPAITGTWNPATVDVNTTKEYEFTPNTLGCYGKTKVTLKVNPLPAITSSVGNYGLCHNTPTDIQFTSNIQNTTFSWKAIPNNVTGAINGTGTSISQLLKLSGTSVGTVEYVVTPMANNCTGSNDTIRLKVQPTVTPSVRIDVTNGITTNATKDTITLCSDDNVSFQAFPTNAGNAPTYEWKLNKAIVGSNSIYFSSSKIKNNDSISLVMISNQVCANPITVYSNVMHAVVKKNPLNITATPAKSCDKLDGSITLKGEDITLYGDIEWTKGSILLGDSNNVSVSTSTPFVINKLGAGSYKLSFKSQACTFKYTATISSPNIPTPATKIAWSKSAPICSGDSVELTALFTGVVPTSFLWMKKNNAVYDTISKTKANIWIKDLGVYGVKLVKSGCVSSSLDTTVTFMSKPTKLAKSVVTHPTCSQPSGSVTLVGLPIGGWKITATPSLGGAIIGKGTLDTTLTLNSSTTYSIRVQNKDGCFSDTTNVTIKQNVIAPSAPKFTIIQQPTCVVKVGSVLLSDLPKGKWTMTSTPATKTFTGKNTLTQFVDSLKDNTTYTFVVKDSNGCASTASLAVPVNPYYGKPGTPSIALTPQTFCSSQKIDQLVTSGSTSPTWYKDAISNAKYLNTEPLVNNRTYYLTQTVGGCESDRLAVSVTLNQGPKLPTLGISYCANTYAQGKDLVSKIKLSNFTVRIFDVLLGTQSLKDLDTLQTKTYYIEADSAGCTNEVRQKVDVKILPGTLPNLTTTIPAICTDNNLTFADVSKEVGSASGLVWYKTLTGGNAIPLTDKLINQTFPQTYYAAYKSSQAGACESKERIKVTITFVPTPIGVPMSENSYKPCKDAIETVANLPTAPGSSNSIDWFISPTAFNPLKTTDQLYSTKYYAASYTKDNVTSKKCYSNTKYVVDVNLYDVAFIVHPENSVCEKNTGVLTIVENEMHGYSPFKISVSDQYGSIVSNALKTSNLPIGEYTIQVTDAKNCKQKVKEMIGCTVYKIPHVITPDDASGTNDRWVIHYYEKYPNVQVTIFNRWGSKVYASAIPYMDDWDGRASSEIQTIGEGYLPAGTYYYVIDKGNGDAVESGYIELLK